MVSEEKAKTASTPKHEIELIEARLKWAKYRYEQCLGDKQ